MLIHLNINDTCEALTHQSSKSNLLSYQQHQFKFIYLWF